MIKSIMLSVIMASGAEGLSINQVSQEMPNQESCIGLARTVVQGGRESTNTSTGVWKVEQTTKGDWGDASIKKTIYCTSISS